MSREPWFEARRRCTCQTDRQACSECPPTLKSDGSTVSVTWYSTVSVTWYETKKTVEKVLGLLGPSATGTTKRGSVVTAEQSGTPDPMDTAHSTNRPSKTDPTFEELCETIARYPDPDDKLTIALGNFNRVRAERDEVKKKWGSAEDLAVVWRERGELAEREKGRLLKIIAWYWRAYGLYPSSIDEGQEWGQS